MIDIVLDYGIVLNVIILDFLQKMDHLGDLWERGVLSYLISCRLTLLESYLVNFLVDSVDGVGEEKTVSFSVVSYKVVDHYSFLDNHSLMNICRGYVIYIDNVNG